MKNDPTLYRADPDRQPQSEHRLRQWGVPVEPVASFVVTNEGARWWVDSSLPPGEYLIIEAADDDEPEQRKQFFPMHEAGVDKQGGDE